ncbi:MAG: hypothetical protein Q8N63_04940 [Nanoarchaeota archaeon]|nr:hypothetical protein [Nanoarchaeota archaeon]
MTDTIDEHVLALAKKAASLVKKNGKETLASRIDNSIRRGDYKYRLDDDCVIHCFETFRTTLVTVYSRKNVKAGFIKIPLPFTKKILLEYSYGYSENNLSNISTYKSGKWEEILEKAA